MARKDVLPLDDPQATLEMVGGKGASLTRLIQSALPVPGGFHISTLAYRRFISENALQEPIRTALAGIDLDKPSTLEHASRHISGLFAAAAIPEQVAEAVVQAYAGLPGQNPPVAVRSSATAEDLPEASFAGQQETYLNVTGAAAVLQAVKRCWASLWTARAIGYRTHLDMASEGVALAVVVQQLVEAEVAGVLFTANPVNGRRDQALISAAWGFGDAVVGGRVTPDNLVVNKESGQIESHEVADKRVMTVRTRRGTEDQPVPEDLRRVPALDAKAAAQLNLLGKQVEALSGMPMDIEWALADGQFFILQARPITALPDEPVPSPEDWDLPEPRGRYMRTSIVDLMPSPLSTLFSTMGLSAYNETLVRMLADFTESDTVAFPQDLVLPIRGYAYMKVNFRLAEWWGMLGKLGPRIPALLRNGPRHFRQVALPAYQATVQRLEGKLLSGMPASELLHDARELLQAAMYHMAVLQVDTLGASAGSEGLFTAVYDRFTRGEGDPPASALLMGYDTVPAQSEQSLYDLAQQAKADPALTGFLLSAPAAEIRAALQDKQPPSGIAPPRWSAWAVAFKRHLREFGYVLYDLDFCNPVPADDPTPLLEVLKMYLRGEGVNPHQRHRLLAEQRKRETERLLASSRGLRGWILRKTLGWAQSMSRVREDSIASIGLGYPRLRALLLELGRRLVEAGSLECPEQVFWLAEAELKAALPALEAGGKLEPMTAKIEERQAAAKTSAKLLPPTTLPPSKTYMGIPIEVFIPGEGGVEGDRLKGVGASGGQATGEACVLHGPEDFDQMRPGAVLVARITTPAWTPLFAMAAAVVTDIGGPLSHGSIVAREYGIPAVLGTVAATHLIQSGQRITVDGDAGLVELLPES